LTEYDAKRVLSGIAEPGNAASPESVIELWRRAARDAFMPEPQAALRLFCIAVAQQQFPTRSLAAQCSAIVRLHGLISAANRHAIVMALASRDVASLYTAAGPADAEVLSCLLGCPIDMLAQVAPEATPPVPEQLYTPFGGLFLLLPTVIELPVPQGFGDDGLFRLWVLSKCFGTERAYPVFSDPVVRSVLRVDPDLGLDTFLGWQKSRPRSAFAQLRNIAGDCCRDNYTVERESDAAYLLAPHAMCASIAKDRRIAAYSRLVLRNFAWRLPGFANSSFRHLFTNFLDVQAAIDVSETVWRVRMGNSALALVLNLSGVSRCTFELPWLDGLTVQLFPEG
jgi:hypothetical protein